jgi:hypothetical protein
VFVAPSADRTRCAVQVMGALNESASPLQVSAGTPIFLDEVCAHPQVAAADVDGDGFTDLALLTGRVEENDRKLYVLWNDGSGGFSNSNLTLVSSSEDSPQAFSVLAASALEPLRLAYVTQTSLRLVRATPNGRELELPETVRDDLNDATGIVAADVNGDRVPDLVLAESGKLRVLKAQLKVPWSAL